MPHSHSPRGRPRRASQRRSRRMRRSNPGPRRSSRRSGGSSDRSCPTTRSQEAPGSCDARDVATPNPVPETLTGKLAELIAAAFPGVLVTSDEPEEVPRDLARLCGERNWNLATWTADDGGAAQDGPADPLAAVKALPQSGDGETPSVQAMVHVHRFLQSAELLAAMRTTLAAGKTRRTHLVLVQPTGELPAELRRDFMTITHPLPSREELDAVARGVATKPGELPEELHPVLDAAAGLTRGEAENAFALSLVRHGKLDPGPLWEIKACQTMGGGPLTLHRGGAGFDALGGTSAPETFCRTALTNGSHAAEAKGVRPLSRRGDRRGLPAPRPAEERRRRRRPPPPPHPADPPAGRELLAELTRPDRLPLHTPRHSAGAFLISHPLEPP